MVMFYHFSEARSVIWRADAYFPCSCSAVRSCWISSKAFIYWGFHLVKQNKIWLPATLCDSTSEPSRGLVEKWVEQMEICQSCPFKVTLTWDLTFYHICNLLRLHTDVPTWQLPRITTAASVGVNLSAERPHWQYLLSHSLTASCFEQVGRRLKHSRHKSEHFSQTELLYVGKASKLDRSPSRSFGERLCCPLNLLKSDRITLALPKRLKRARTFSWYHSKVPILRTLLKGNRRRQNRYWWRDRKYLWEYKDPNNMDWMCLFCHTKLRQEITECWRNKMCRFLSMRYIFSRY